MPTTPSPPAADAYDAVADAYDRFWGDALAPDLLPALDRLLAPLRPAARLLDLCCGAGQLTAALIERGWDVVAVDGSPALLARARRRAPGATCAAADLRRLDADDVLAPLGPFDAVVCAFDSLNHLADATELTSVCRAVVRALRPGGRFVFDLNDRDGFEARFDGTFAFVDADLVCAARADFDGTYGRYRLTVFRPLPPSGGGAGGGTGDRAGDEPGGGAPADGPSAWGRTDTTLVQRCFEVAEVLAALDAAGFEAPTVLDAEADLGMDGHIGRIIFVADRPGAVAG